MEMCHRVFLFIHFYRLKGAIKMGKYYRFELVFFDEPQDVGFLQGIDEIGLPVHTERLLLDQFASLPCPHLTEPCEFWFTEEGLQTFGDAIDLVNKEIQPLGWNIIGGVMEDDGAIAIYRDAWQAAWSPTYLETDIGSFKKIVFSKDLICSPSERNK